MTPSITEGALQRISTPDASGCMPWTGKVNSSGYGEYVRMGRTYRAHRLSYEIFVGPIPDGLVIDHLCRNRRCCNPCHLEPVTAAENTRRGWPVIKPTCVNGHEYTPENTYARPNGGKDCRACIRARVRRYKKGHQAA